MKHWIIILYIITILFLPVYVFSAPMPVQPSAAEFPEKTVSLVQLSFEESIATLSQIFDVKIYISGVSTDSQTRFNLNMEHANLEQAVKEAIRKAGVQNHALVWDKTGKTLRLLAFESGKPGTISENSTNAAWENMRPLTQEQLFLLAQQGAAMEAEDAESMKPLTPEQMQQLREQGAEMAAEDAESMKPLTPEQIQQLKEQGAEMAEEDAESMKPLTPEQIQQLKEQSVEIAAGEEERMKPLTPEQIQQLREQNAHTDLKNR